jgi:hypothetical protein
MAWQEHRSSASLLNEYLDELMPGFIQILLICSENNHLEQGSASEKVGPAGNVPWPKGAVPREIPDNV